MHLAQTESLSFVLRIKISFNAGWATGETYKDCISIKIVILPASLQWEAGDGVPGDDLLLQGEPHQAVPDAQGETGDVHQPQPGGGAGAVSPVSLEVLGGEAGATGGLWGWGRYQSVFLYQILFNFLALHFMKQVWPQIDVSSSSRMMP